MRATMLVAVLLVPAAARADVDSGPKAGEKVSELKVFAVAGGIENKEVDYAAERKDAPTVYLFVNADKFSRPIARFVKELDKKLGDTAGKPVAVAVWVGGDADKLKEYMPKVQTSLQTEVTAFTVFTGGAGGPTGWGINGDAHLTAVVATAGKVVKSFGFESTNETDVPAVVEALKKATAK